MKVATPRIGITWITSGNAKSERYLQALAVHGANPVALHANAGSWDVELSTISGLLLTGGADVDPALYGEENLGSQHIDPRRDAMERDAIRQCLDRHLPVFAICRGLQFVNAVFGGSLIQDIKTEIPHRGDNDQSAYHPVEVRSATWLASVLGAQESLRVNSRHHQGVDLARVGPKLRVSAIAPDGIVEGLELTEGPFLVAVQWHPEYLEQVPHLSALFTAFVKRVVSP